MSSKLRFGIMSAAQIARKNWKAIRNSGNATVTAVASRDRQKAAGFITECQADAPMEKAATAMGSYEELLASKEVDAVYIPVPTGLRKDWVIRAAEAGKHVVCEKPCASSLADLRQMIDACARHKVQFMDGVMFMHSRRLEALRAMLDDRNAIGDLKRITSAFSFPADDEFYAANIRAHSELEPFGALGDLGWYCIRLALWTMREELPRRVTGRILHQVRGPGSPGSVPTEFSGELLFDDGISSSFYASFDTANEQWAIISGTKGLVRISDFVLPFYGNEVIFEHFQAELEKFNCDFNMEPNRRRIAISEYSNSFPDSQETNLFRNFSAQVQSGKLEPAWPQFALNTQTVLEACLASAHNDSAPVDIP